MLPVAVVALALTVSFAATSSAVPWRVVAWNDLGMHCMDADYSVFAILPPYNNLHAQVIDSSGNLLTDPSAVIVTYKAVADPAGSYNSTSVGKTNFWDFVQALFGVALAPDHGLAGQAMPGLGNVPQSMTFDAARSAFLAIGIPITPYDDDLRKNTYPMVRVEVHSTSGTLLASTDVVLPVSNEMDCRTCHGSNTVDQAKPSSGWVNDCDTNRDYRLNILKLHDDRQGGQPSYVNALSSVGYDVAGLYATVTVDGTAVLCASCHSSNALPGTGLPGIAPLTQDVHGYHAGVTDPITGQTLDDSQNRSACYRCHPGSETRCLRGAMGAAVAADGSLAMQCQSCHGNMSHVGASTRQGWLDEPVCQNCHTGTAVNNSGQIRYTSVFGADGLPRTAADQTFATNPDTPAPGISLFRFSSGHGGLQCEGCHGATHAIYPSSHANDNVQNIALQGHAGTIAECASCHGSNPSTVTGGPHGMHPVGQSWVSAHPDAVESGGGSSQCRACHGLDYRGTVLSRASADRTLSTPFGTKQFWRGFQVGCYDCHNGPSSENGNPNHAPSATGGQVATQAYTPVSVTLAANDVDGNPLSYRVVAQPANSTVALSGSVATVYPSPGFVGTGGFTFAAADGSTWSNLATISIDVDGSFADVPSTSYFASYIERLYHASVTTGCASPPLLYCPTSPVTRAQMAVFLERGVRGPAYQPPAATGIFADVPVGSFYAPWVEQLWRDGITTGCASSPLRYCPDVSVTRAQMAVFLERARHQASCTYVGTGGLFTDVPAGYWAAGFIEELWRDDVTQGCGNGKFCPETAVTRDQMAAFLVRAFRLP